MKNATRILVSTFGTLVGLAGLEHGVGEILQGNIVVEGLMILSWPDSKFFRVVGGEPAMTIVQNMMVTGLLAILISLVFIGWSVWGTHRRNGGWIMGLLSIALLLFGGGIFPPVLGMIIAAIGTKIGSPLLWWHTHLSTPVQSGLIKAWPWTFAACIAVWLGMVPGLPTLDYFFGIESEVITLGLLACMFLLLFMTSIAGFACDSRWQADYSFPHPQYSALK